ncbi:MAG: hypothetical protein JWO63_1306 [Frankiales bacterium]|nr:hypothetical protein [Frankiales bacterium]
MPRASARAHLRALFVRLLAALVITVLGVAGWQVVGRDGGPVAPLVAGPILTTATALGSAITAAAPTAVLVGPDAGVRLVAYGFVQRYLIGDSTRSAPPGRRLIAFAARPVAGEDASNPPAVSLQVGAQESGLLVMTSGYVVASVPMAPTNIDLILTDGGLKQSLSLLDGTPSAANPAVAERVHQTASVQASAAVSVKVQAVGRAAGVTSGTFTVRSVSLSYWGMDGSHPSEPGEALLHVSAMVKLAGDHIGYGAEAGLLSVTSDTSTISAPQARNAAPDPATEVDDVVEVPADLTSGVIHYAGTITSASGEIWVLNPVSVPFSIPAG